MHDNVPTVNNGTAQSQVKKWMLWLGQYSQATVCYAVGLLKYNQICN